MINFFKKEIDIQTNKTFEFVKITEKIQKLINDLGVKQGFFLVRSPHTTAAIVVTEDDSPLHRDFQMIIEKMISLDWQWKHIGEGKINARAHQIALLLGNNIWTPIVNGKISLGTWQDIFLVECLEAKSRRVEVVILAM